MYFTEEGFWASQNDAKSVTDKEQNPNIKEVIVVDRREFLKSVIGASFFSFIPAPFINTINLDNDETLPSPELIISKESPRNRRIFCLFDHPELEAEIERCAEEIGCEVLHGEPCSPDILVLGGF